MRGSRVDNLPSKREREQRRRPTKRTGSCCVSAANRLEPGENIGGLIIWSPTAPSRLCPQDSTVRPSPSLLQPLRLRLRRSRNPATLSPGALSRGHLSAQPCTPPPAPATRSQCRFQSLHCRVFKDTVLTGQRPSQGRQTGV